MHPTCPCTRADRSRVRIARARAAGNAATRSPTADGTSCRPASCASSFHTSRYNVNTGRLTEAMFDAVVARASLPSSPRGSHSAAPGDLVGKSQERGQHLIADLVALEQELVPGHRHKAGIGQAPTVASCARLLTISSRAAWQTRIGSRSPPDSPVGASAR